MEGVEIKVNVDGVDIDGALGAFGRDGEGSRMVVSFVEDTTVGVELPLLAAGIVVRTRERRDDDDVTVKLRPCRRSQLPHRWLDGDASEAGMIKVEQDWSGARRVLSVSCRAVHSSGVVAAVRDGDAPIRSLLTKTQRQFLDDCASIRVNIDALTLLPGVRARRWKPVALAGVDADVDLERWTVEDLDFLEFSIKLASVDRAEAAQGRLEAELHERHVPASSARETKTALVLGRLVELHLRAATVDSSLTSSRR
jgi:hypothetical protein